MSQRRDPGDQWRDTATRAAVAAHTGLWLQAPQLPQLPFETQGHPGVDRKTQLPYSTPLGHDVEAGLCMNIRLLTQMSIKIRGDSFKFTE